MNFSSLEELFKGFEPEPGAKPPVAVQKALFLACRLQQRAAELQTPPVLQAGAEAGECVVSVPVSSEGRLELLWYVQEQSISIDYHRYGNLGQRAAEERAGVL